MSKVKITVSEDLKGFFRYIGDSAAHEQSADLDATLDIICRFNVQPDVKPFDAATLLRECHIIARQAAVGLSSAESEIEKIRLQQEERRYQESVKDLKLSKHAISDDVRDMRETYLVVSNFFLSFVGSFLFGFFSTQLFLNWRFEYCVFAGVAAAVLILGVEAVLFVIRDEKKLAARNHKHKAKQI
jgi:hypothetical protein